MTTSTLAAALALLAAAPLAPPPAAPTLRLEELLERDGDALRPSARTASLAGKRVHLDGFMAQMEEPPAGGFWLVPRPLECDESGDGSGDLPPSAIFVVVRSAGDGAVAFRPGLLSVTGVLELGPRAGRDGRVSSVRVLLDGPPRATPRSKHRSAPSPEVRR